MAPSEKVAARENELIDKIREIKGSLGQELLILGHFYQRLSITRLSDHLGDSFGLSARAAASAQARFIVFCGVAFMAESAAILCSPGQTVYHPHRGAGCPMADMADPNDVEQAFRLTETATGRKVIPVAYMNTNSEVKAFCGERGGIICTSSNAERAFQWAFKRGEVVLFIPDEHLGTNTANGLEIPSDERAIYDPRVPGDTNARSLSRKTRVVLWRGHCHVHTWFTPDHIRAARLDHGDAKIVVHPECPQEVVALADHSGSTAFMLNYVKNAPKGSTIVVGTEFNMVQYLAHHFGREKTVLPLSRSFCPNMYKIHLENLCDTLQRIRSGEASPFRVEVEPGIRDKARLALDRMLELS